ncbi:MAG: hypothetical protein AMXMBFR53_32010 [Gemmatimonadota bacterium]
MDPQRSRGFTLIELLIVVVIIGILAAVAIPKFSRAREKAFLAAVTSDLKNLANQQEMYLSSYQTYASTLTLLPNFAPTEGVNLSINTATGTGWAATGTHNGLPTSQCGFYYGGAASAQASPATLPGQVACQ